MYISYSQSSFFFALNRSGGRCPFMACTPYRYASYSAYCSVLDGL